MRSMNREDLEASIKEGSHTSFGCYPKFAIARDGGVLCMHCLEEEIENIMPSQGNDPDPQWGIVAIEANWEDPDLFCDNCDERIESAYSEES